MKSKGRCLLREDAEILTIWLRFWFDMVVGGLGLAALAAAAGATAPAGVGGAGAIGWPDMLSTLVKQSLAEGGVGQGESPVM